MNESRNHKQYETKVRRMDETSVLVDIALGEINQDWIDLSLICFCWQLTSTNKAGYKNNNTKLRNSLIKMNKEANNTTKNLSSKHWRSIVSRNKKNILYTKTNEYRQMIIGITIASDELSSIAYKSVNLSFCRSETPTRWNRPPCGPPALRLLCSKFCTCSVSYTSMHIETNAPVMPGFSIEVVTTG